MLPRLRVAADVPLLVDTESEGHIAADNPRAATRASAPRCRSAMIVPPHGADAEVVFLRNASGTRASSARMKACSASLPWPPLTPRASPCSCSRCRSWPCGRRAVPGTRLVAELDPRRPRARARRAPPRAAPRTARAWRASPCRWHLRPEGHVFLGPAVLHAVPPEVVAMLRANASYHQRRVRGADGAGRRTLRYGARDASACNTVAGTGVTPCPFARADLAATAPRRP